MNIVNYITHEITIWSTLIILAIGILFKVGKYFIKEYYNAKKFLKKHKMSERDMKIESRKATMELSKSFTQLSNKVDRLTEAFTIYVEGNGVPKEVKSKVKKLLDVKEKRTLKVKK